MNLSHNRFLATDGYKLAGLLYKPEVASTRVAIYLHGNGYGSIFESVEKMTTFGTALTEQGISFFPFNNRGSNMVRKLKRDVESIEEEKKGGTAYEVIKDCLKDIDGTIAYLKEQGFTEFYLIGESTGANKICVYNYYTNAPEIAKVVLLSGGDDTGIYYEMLGREKFLQELERASHEMEAEHGEVIPKDLDFGLSYQAFYDTCNPDGDYNIFPYNEFFNDLHLAKKPLFREYESLKMPVLVVYGANDEFCYGRVPEIVQLLEKNTQSVHFKGIIIPDTDHGLTGKVEEGARSIAEWLANS